MRSWNETLVMAALGLFSVGLVVVVSQLFARPTADSTSRQAPISAQVQALRSDVQADDRAIVKKLDQLETALRDLQQKSDPADARSAGPPTVPSTDTRSGVPPPVPTDPPIASAPTSPAPGVASSTLGIDPHTGSGSAQGALIRGWQYIARQEFDPGEHEQVIANLVKAYAVEGLTPEMNSSLIATIQQVNEIAIARALTDARGLSPTDAARRLRALLETAPRLTSGQRARINAALATYGDVVGTRRPTNARENQGNTEADGSSQTRRRGARGSSVKEERVR
jgi:hypothetical protein